MKPRKFTHLVLIAILTAVLLLSCFAVVSCNNDGKSDVTSAQTYDETTDTQEESTTEAQTTEAIAEETTEEATTEEETTVDLTVPTPAEGYIWFYGADDLAGCSKISGVTITKEMSGDTAYAKILTASESPYINPVSKTTTDSGRYVTICYRTETKQTGLLHIGAEDKTLSTQYGQTVKYEADGAWHTVTLDLFDNLNYSGDIFKFLRYQPTVGSESEQEVDVAWIAMYKNDGAAYVCKQDFGETATTDMPNLSGYKQLDGGAYYNVSGYATESQGNCYFEDKLEYNIYYRANFNRYTLKYTSDSYLKGEITYLMNDGGNISEKTETIYLEPGENVVFNSLIDDYLKNKYAYGISKLTITSYSGEGNFKLEEITSNTARVFAAGTYYVANDRYIVGVYLSWGGGISYIEDRQDGIEKVTSLINSCDTGRLIQQSYYGVSTTAYHQASYGGSVWNYNPVQGGDQYGNVSKIVDFTISDDGKTIYVKAQPMDWAQNNMICPAYMENTYTITDDAICVDNRFVDYFGYTGSARHQELPAFYTISYLGTFCYYNGTKPWTGDDYITLEDQPFWGGNNSCYHNINSKNTETWAAWVDDNGYGIGLYVPDTEIMLAGRHSYSGSKDYKNGATNYVAPLRTFTLKSYEPFEYSYVIAAGTVDQMREVFAKYK